MKKIIIQRGLTGIPLGIAIGYIITVIMSLIFGEGSYNAVMPQVVEQVGSEMTAIVVQLLLWALLGGASAASSAIWEADNWSIFKQTGLYFLLLAITLLPISYFMHWMERSLMGFLIYSGGFVVIFIIMWLIQYLVWKHKVKKMNEKLRSS